MANTTGEWPKNNFKPLTEHEIASAEFIKAHIKIPDQDDCTEVLWFRVMEVLPKLKKVTARLYTPSFWQPDMKVGTKLTISYDQIVDVREGATTNIEGQRRSLD